MNLNELTCKELVEIITEYLEGTLSLPERARFEQHLTRCDGCTTYLAQMRQTIHVLGKLTEESIQPDAKQELLEVFRNWKRERA